jgi:hypothetical protein
VVGTGGLHSALVFGPHEQFVRHLGWCWPSTQCPTSSGWTAG